MGRYGNYFTVYNGRYENEDKLDSTTLVSEHTIPCD